jgi:Flp pilus assembly pilin Flp
MNELIRKLLSCRLWKERKGQDLVEYALLAGFITVAVAAAFPPLEGGINTIFSKIGSLLAQT